MSTGVPPIGPGAPVPRAYTPPPDPTVPAFTLPSSAATVPSSPPPEVSRAVAAAAQVVKELRASGRELRFEVDKASRRVVIEVRDLNGTVIRTIPNEKALAVAAGEPLD